MIHVSSKAQRGARAFIIDRADENLGWQSLVKYFCPLLKFYGCLGLPTAHNGTISHTPAVQLLTVDLWS